MSIATDTIRNGVDTEKMFATLDLIKAQPELARFQFRARDKDAAVSPDARAAPALAWVRSSARTPARRLQRTKTGWPAHLRAAQTGSAQYDRPAQGTVCGLYPGQSKRAAAADRGGFVVDCLSEDRWTLTRP